MPTDLIVREQPAPLLPMEPEDAALMMERYRALCESILSPDDVIGVPGQPGGFVKRSGWSKLATFYGASTELVHLDVDVAFPAGPKQQLTWVFPAKEAKLRDEFNEFLRKQKRETALFYSYLNP